MDCTEIRDALLKGDLPADADVDAHILGCDSCRDLLEADAVLGRQLASLVEPAELPSGLGAAVEQTILFDAGLLGWLKSRRTRVRVLLLVGLSVLLAALQRLGKDFELGSGVLVTTLVLLALLSVCGLFLLRPLFLPERRWAAWILVVLATALPFALSIGPHNGDSLSDSSWSDSSWGGMGAALSCFGYGAAWSAGFLLGAVLLVRQRLTALTLVLLLGATSGLSAYLLLAFHCPNAHPLHLLGGHAGIGALWIALGALRRALQTRASASPT